MDRPAQNRPQATLEDADTVGVTDFGMGSDRAGAPSAGGARRAALLIAVVFAVWRFGVLDQPPVWDGAMGMTPAALTLESLDFNVAELLRMPDYRAGGPNIHSLSLATWVVAASVRIAGSYAAALPVLHVMSFALVGLLGGGVFRAVRRATASTPAAVLASVAATVFPPMVVQASDVYLDLPLAVAVTWAFVYLFEARLLPAVALLCLAAAIKPSAVIALPPAMLFIDQSKRFRSREVAWMGAPAVVALIPLVVDAALRPRSGFNPSLAAGYFQASMANLLRVRTLLPVLGLLVVVTGLLIARSRRQPLAGEDRLPLVLAATALPITFLAFFLFNPIVTKGLTALPRYTTLFLPVVVVALAVGTHEIWPRRGSVAAMAIVTLLFALNIQGRLEPDSVNAYWQAERSLVYEDFLDVQQRAFAAFAVEAADTPSYYDHFRHFLIEYPETGWLDAEIPSGTNERLEPLDEEDLPGLPDRFVMLIERLHSGGLASIRDRAMSDPGYAVELQEFVNGEFTNQVVVVTRLSR